LLSSRDHELTKHQQPLWRVLVIVLAICGLTVSVATRTFRLTVPHGTTVQSNSPHAMRQHLDRDAARWIPPIQSFPILPPPVFDPYVPSTRPSLQSALLDESLYNRPPPSC
jgi:hypothetical protein